MSSKLNFTLYFNIFSFLIYKQRKQLSNPKTAGGEGGGHLDSPLWFFEISKERVKPWHFATFNIIISHNFPESFIEVPQVSLLQRN